MTDPEFKKQRIRDFLNAMGSGDLDGLKAAVTLDCKVWTAGEAWYTGDHTLEDLLVLTAKVLPIFPNGIQFTVHNMVAEGNQVAVEATSHADHISGKTYANKYHFLFSFSGDRISAYKEYMDTELAVSFLGKHTLPA